MGVAQDKSVFRRHIICPTRATATITRQRDMRPFGCKIRSSQRIGKRLRARESPFAEFSASRCLIASREGRALAARKWAAMTRPRVKRPWRDAPGTSAPAALPCDGEVGRQTKQPASGSPPTGRVAVFPYAQSGDRTHMRLPSRGFEASDIRSQVRPSE